MAQVDPASRSEALQLLQSLGASHRLLRHGEIVSEVATAISDILTRLQVQHDRLLVIVGAALHDVGKIVLPQELEGDGNRHEAEGEILLLQHGLSSKLARVCRTHGAWDDKTVAFEERLIALADHIWKGTRDEHLESLVTKTVAELLKISDWEAFVLLDVELERIASDATNRLARSQS